MRWLKPQTAKKMTSKQAAWLAGFFDGEGSVGFWKKSGRQGKYESLSFLIPNTFRPALVHCVHIAGCGSIRPKPKRKPHNKSNWVWKVSAQRDVIAILKQIFPYLTVKHSRVKKILSRWKDTNALPL